MRPTRRGWLGTMIGGISLLACGDDPPTAAERLAARTPTPPLKDKADILIVGGRIATMDARRPFAEAMAIRGGAVQLLGRRAELELLAGPNTKVIDLGGGVAVPGLTDAHAHFVGIGASLETIDLRGAKSIDEVVSRCKAGARPDGWVIGRGWDQNLWTDTTMPTHEALTAAFPDRPVWLRRVDGHAGWANKMVLERALITADTEDPAGGEILRNEEGFATGVLVDTAMSLVDVPGPTDDDVRRQMLAAQDHLLERGLVGIHDMGVSKQAHAIYEELVAAGKLRVRVTGYADESWFERDLATTNPAPFEPDARYALVGVKLYADGALGSRGAALLSTYTDRAGHRGKLQHSREWFERVTTEAIGRDWQVATHAIGDRGIRTVLDAYEAAIHRHRHKEHRLRIEHAQIISPEDVGRFASLQVIASMQPTHATSDMSWVPARIGIDRIDRAYAWTRFLKAGVRVPFGSDAPVERADVTFGLHAAVTRQNAAGEPEGGWTVDQALTLDEALRCFTQDAAYAARREAVLGKFAIGYRADITCFADDLWKLEPTQLRDAKILATLVDGVVEFQAP